MKVGVIGVPSLDPPESIGSCDQEGDAAPERRRRLRVANGRRAPEEDGRMWFRTVSVLRCSSAAICFVERPCSRR